MRSDAEAAVAVLVDESAERDRRVFPEALRRETRFNGATKVHVTSEEDGDDRDWVPRGRNYRGDETEGDRDDADVVRPPTPRSRAPREPAARTRATTRPDDDEEEEEEEEEEDLGDDYEEEDRFVGSRRRINDWARGFDVRLDRAGNASAVRLGGVDDSRTESRTIPTTTTRARRVPWGHGPGTAGEEARAKRAASARVGGLTGPTGPTSTRAPPRRSRSASPARGPNDPPNPVRARANPNPNPKPSGKVYEMLSREVDALRDALESQLGSEAEILSINDELRRRCEGAEQATERAERERERAVRSHSGAMARVVNELREAKELAESLASALEQERADRVDESRAKEEERQRSEEVLRRKAGQMSERAAALDRELAATRSELDDVRGSLTTHLLSEERRVGADALRSRYAAKRSGPPVAVTRGRGQTRPRPATRVLPQGRRVRLTHLVLTRAHPAPGACHVGPVVQEGRGCGDSGVAARRARRRRRRVPAPASRAASVVRERGGAQGDAAAGGGRGGARAELERLEEAARVQAERLEEEARVEAERAEHKKNLGDYADAVLAASSPALRNARKLATLHKSLSTWRIALIRSQRAGLDDLAGTCDDLARAAENAAAAAAGVEHRNTELGDAAEALRERIIVAEQRAEEFERAASVESAERKAMEEELESSRTAPAARRSAPPAPAPPRRWRPVARRLPRWRRRARRRRGARRRRWVSARSSPRRRRCRSGPRRLSGRRLELRDRREGGTRRIGNARAGARGTPPRMSPKKLALLASPLGSSLKSPHSMSPSNPVAFLRRVDGSPGLAGGEEARLHSRLEHLPVRARGLHETLRGAIGEARALRERLRRRAGERCGGRSRVSRRCERGQESGEEK